MRSDIREEALRSEQRLDLACALACHTVLLSGATPDARLCFAKRIHNARGRPHTSFVIADAVVPQVTHQGATVFFPEIERFRQTEQMQLTSWLEKLKDTWPNRTFVVSGTGHDPLSLVDLGRLDPTLFYRLNVVHIKLGSE